MDIIIDTTNHLDDVPIELLRDIAFIHLAKVDALNGCDGFIQFVAAYPRFARDVAERSWLYIPRMTFTGRAQSVGLDAYHMAKLRICENHHLICGRLHSRDANEKYRQLPLGSCTYRYGLLHSYDGSPSSRQYAAYRNTARPKLAKMTWHIKGKLIRQLPYDDDSSDEYELCDGSPSTELHSSTIVTTTNNDRLSHVVSISVIAITVSTTLYWIYMRYRM